MSTISPVWSGWVDDASTQLIANQPDIASAVDTYLARDGVARELVASLEASDEQLPQVRMSAAGVDVPVSVRVSGGAGAIPGACRLAGKGGTPLHSLEIALRDLDDLAGNARRVTTAVDQAVAEGLMDDELPVYVELPQSGPGVPSHGWLAAADEVAAMEHRLVFRLNAQPAASSPTLAAWVDAALDRELLFRCAGPERAVTRTDEDGSVEHGWVNLLLATRAAFDGVGLDDVVFLLEGRSSDRLLELAGDGELARGRRWFASLATPAADRVLEDLRSLDLLDAP